MKEFPIRIVAFPVRNGGCSAPILRSALVAFAWLTGDSPCCPWHGVVGSVPGVDGLEVWYLCSRSLTAMEDSSVDSMVRRVISSGTEPFGAPLCFRFSEGLAEGELVRRLSSDPVRLPAVRRDHGLPAEGNIPE